jgi:tetratricopeptide (TPR) repeat protein
MYNIWRVKHKKQNHKRKKIFKFNALSPILVIPLFPILFLILSVSMSLGVADYKDQKYDKAKKHFQTASGLGADLNGRSFNNLGNTFYRLGQYQESAENYQKAIDAARKYGFKKHIAKYYYNLGNAYFRIGENEIEQNPQKTVEYWLQAIEFYKQALEYNPDDQEAQENIEYIKSLLENAQKEKDGKDGDKEGEEGEESEEEVNEKEMDDAIDKVTKEDKKNREDANDNRKYYEDGGGGSSDYDYDEPYW